MAAQIRAMTRASSKAQPKPSHRHSSSSIPSGTLCFNAGSSEAVPFESQVSDEHPSPAHFRRLCASIFVESSSPTLHGSTQSSSVDGGMRWSFRCFVGARLSPSGNKGGGARMYKCHSIGHLRYPSNDPTRATPPRPKHKARGHQAIPQGTITNYVPPKAASLPNLVPRAPQVRSWVIYRRDMSAPKYCI